MFRQTFNCFHYQVPEKLLHEVYCKYISGTICSNDMTLSLSHLSHLRFHQTAALFKLTLCPIEGCLVPIWDQLWVETLILNIWVSKNV